MELITDALEKPLVEQLKQIKATDFVIGIPSYNNAGTIGHVARAVRDGLLRYYPQHRAVILNSDGTSSDDTQNVFLRALNYEKTSLSKLSARYQGVPGKGSAVRTIFTVMQALGAKAGVMVDGDLRSITPEWMKLLLDPIVSQGQDYVTPYYERHKNDGTITNMAVYPLTHTLYGQRIRQPIGGDFAFSSRLAQRYLADPVWQTDVARFGVDIWMTTLALAEGYRVCQVRLGAKIHDVKDPGESLGPMFKQVVGTLFTLVGRYQHVWHAVSQPQDAPVFGALLEVSPPEVAVSLSRLVQNFKVGFQQHESLLAASLPVENLNELKALTRQTGVADFAFPVDLWVKLLYDFAVAFQTLPAAEQQALVEALAPLYMGKTAAFVAMTQTLNDKEAEALVQTQCARFMALKPYLIERWQQAGLDQS